MRASSRVYVTRIMEVVIKGPAIKVVLVGLSPMVEFSQAEVTHNCFIIEAGIRYPYNLQMVV